MDQAATKVASDHEIEIIPPTRDKNGTRDTQQPLFVVKKRAWPRAWTSTVEAYVRSASHPNRVSASFDGVGGSD